MRWILALPLLLTSTSVAQTTWYASGTCDDTGSGTETDPFCLVQEAIDAAASGDVVVVGPGIYAEDLVVPGIPLTLRSSAGAEQTELRGRDGAALELLPGAKLRLEDLTISRPADPRQGLIGRQASLTVERCRFVGTRSVLQGGAIQLEDGELVVLGTSFLDTSAYRGGAIAALGSSVRIEGCSFTRTSGYMGGALLVEDGALLVSESAFLEASASFGGAIHALNGSLRIDDCLFLRNGGFAIDYLQGGALWLESVQAVVARSSFEECRVFSSASVMRVAGGSLVLEDCLIADNFVADLAGTVVVLDADARVERCDFRDNVASDGWGGALYVEVRPENEILVRDCLFARNVADEGGAVCIRRGFAQLERCRFTANRTGRVSYYERGHGGGLYVGGFPMEPPGATSARVLRCVFDKNLARGHDFIHAGRGGGLFGPVEALNCTFYANLVDAFGAPDAPSGGAAGGGAVLRNCITWMDSPEPLDGSTAAEWSDVEPAWPGAGNFAADPRYRDADAGDFRLLASSPCIDRGDPVQLDDDGTRIDVGAFPFAPDRSFARRR